MTFEDFEKAGKRDLKREAKQCFDECIDQSITGDVRTARLLEAQFYMGELDRRSSSRIALRDLLLEIVVILLIGAEIGLAVKQGTDEDRLMDKQNGILTKLQNATSDTATSVKALSDITKAMGDNTSASAKTLLSLRTTTETMNKGVHDQISLFYDPSFALTYNTEQNRIQFMNTGRTSLKLTVVKMNGEMKNLGGTKLISPGTYQYVEVVEEYKKIASGLAKGAFLSVPVEAHLENEIGKHYVMNGALFFIWENDKITVHAQTISVQPEP
jgi:hypothetical protein